MTCIGTDQRDFEQPQKLFGLGFRYVAAHRSDWARRASVVPMQPCWTLMGVEDATGHGAEGAADPATRCDLARPPAGALAEFLGRPVDWLDCNVHRWRCAMPQAQRFASGGAHWWDAAQGLGVCGDFLGGGVVEGAWSSAQSLAKAMLQSAPEALDVPAEITSPGSAVRRRVQRLGQEGVNTSASGQRA